jgi:hypothetical protein
MVMLMRSLVNVISGICFLIFPFVGSGQDDIVRISGVAPGHAGGEIVFYSWKDQISFTEKELFRFTVDERDEFFAEFEVAGNPLHIFSHTGRYFIYMYVEGGTDYQVVLPPKTDKAPHERLNPYFEGIPTHIAVVNHDSTELNALVRTFENMYNPLLRGSLAHKPADEGRIFIDSVSVEMDRWFKEAEHPWFNDYRNYKMGHLSSIARFHAARRLSDDHFLNAPVLYDNIAYMELFNQVYNRYFLFFSRTVRGSRIFDDINRKQSLSLLMNTLRTDSVLGGEQLLELVVLKGLHDAFYSDDFSRSGLLAVLDSLALVTGYPEHARISKNIREKVIRLLTGFDPPGFTLADREGNMRDLSDFRGSYVYLNFCTATSYSCLSEFEILKHLRGRHDGYLKIVTVLIDKDHQSMLNFLNKNDYDWDFLFYGNQPSVLKDYDIRMYPSYYLIDRDGTLLMSPAPSPAENFELHLLRTMRSRGEAR